MSQKVTGKPTEADIGAALLAWYGASLRQFPDGLVSQAQAAAMLGIGRMAMSRLVGRGYLRAIYFPKPPDIEGVSVGEDDPTWLKLLGWFGRWTSKITMPKACYVSFGDVIELWLRGDARERCKLEWRELIAGFRSKNDELRQWHNDRVTQSHLESANHLHQMYDLDKDGKNKGRYGSVKLFLHDELLEWYERQAESLELTRNQLVFWALQQWQSQIEQGESGLPRLPTQEHVNSIEYNTKLKLMDRCRGIPCRYIRVYDEFGGDLGIYSDSGLKIDGTVD